MNFNVILTEIFTAALGLVLIPLGLVLPADKRKVTGICAVIGLVAILAYTVYQGASGYGFFMGGFYSSDALSGFFKIVFISAAILVVLSSLSYSKKFEDGGHEYFAFIVMGLLGMMTMISANDIITLYIGLEFMTISFVIMSAFDKKNPASSEAGLKYLLLSALSSGILLYGLSLVYGLSGSTLYSEIWQYLKAAPIEPIGIMAIVMLIAGFAFKIASIPFHMWSPDVYEGSPTPTTSFLSIGSKAAAFAVLIRLFLEVLPSGSNGLVGLLIALSVLSMVIGNIIALPQKNMKRLLAYSSIAQGGYVLLGLIVSTQAGFSAMLYYIVLYVIANAGIFAAVIAFSNRSGSEDIKSFQGMWKRSPFLTAVLIINLLSLAGIPPAAGFIGKFYLFAEVIKGGYFWLAALAIAMSLVSVFYYIVVIRTAILGEAKEEEKLKIPLSLTIVMVLTSLLTLAMGIYPGPFTEWTSRVISLFPK